MRTRGVQDLDQAAPPECLRLNEQLRPHATACVWRTYFSMDIDEPIVLGPYRLSATGTTLSIGPGQSAKKVDGLYGTAIEYLVIGDDGTDLLVHDTRWNNGHRDVRVAERNETPPPYDTVVGRLRIGVDPIEEDLFMELRQAQTKPNGRAQVVAASVEELDEGAGTSVSRALRALGAQVGTKEVLLGRKDQTRRRMCCRFPSTAELVPATALVLTRIAPVGRGYRWRS